MNETNITNVEESFTYEDADVGRLYFYLKRMADIFCSIIGCIVLIPLTIIIKICYILSGDFSPIIFKQDRIGKDGKTIKIYKYRSMVVGADKILKDLIENNPEIAEEYKRNKKLNNDPRITKVGRIIRATSIDEFPQFINVLKGEMSIVGPRPYLHREIKDMGEYYDTIIKSKPGVTGYWQVNGRSGTNFVKRLVMDEYYYYNRGIILDVKIFIKTILKVVKKDGAK